MKHVVVVGGGIAGLAAANRLQALARTPSTSSSRRDSGTRYRCSVHGTVRDWAADIPLKLTLIEREPRLGGKILTERVDAPDSDLASGFVIEGGADSFLAYKPWGVALCQELGLTDRLQGTNPLQRKTYVMHRGRLHELPAGLTGMIPTRFAPMLQTSLLSWRGKLRMGLDLVRGPRPENGDESVAAFISRRLGSEVYERLIEPLMGGIYAADATQLSLAATFPQLRQLELEHGGLIKGSLARRAQLQSNGNRAVNGAHASQANRSVFLTPFSGMAEIVQNLVKQLANETLLTNTTVQQIEPADDGFKVHLAAAESIQADAVILATPAFATAKLLQSFDKELAAVLAEIAYVSTATVSLAFQHGQVPRPLDGYGYVIPRAEGGDILACTWTSTKFPHRAPPGYVLLRAYVGRAGRQTALESDDQALLQLVRDELEGTLGITTEPLFHRIYRWPQAMPQYTLGHPERLIRIDRRVAAHAGLFVAGAAYRGIGIPDCINSGEQAACAALRHLHPEKVATSD